MKKNTIRITLLFGLAILFGCTNESTNTSTSNNQKQSASTLVSLPVIFDTDANNELDDQHALAYLLFNESTFDVKAITVNTTYNGGNIDEQYEEAERVMKLCKKLGKIPLLKGANASFNAIKDQLQNENYDGVEAIDYIIKEAKKYSNEKKLVVIAVGKLTNVALAIEKDPSIIDKIRLVWLGANYPDPGEYNLENDIPSMNYLLDSSIEFEVVTVRYGKPSGTDAVSVTKEEALDKMPGLGPKIDRPIIGRHGGEFSTFGDYSVNLFEHIDYYGIPPKRALFDMAAVAIVKDGNWAKATAIPSPIMIDSVWVERPENKRAITLWEHFNKKAILEDFYSSLQNSSGH